MNWLAKVDGPRDYAPGAFQMGHLRRLMESLPDMLERVPDQSLLASEAGAGNEHVAVTRDARGRYALLYSAVGSPHPGKYRLGNRVSTAEDR